jgi:hypothetical protein
MDHVSTLTGKEQIPLVDEAGKNVRVDAGLLYGKTAYQLALDAGFQGDEAAYLASLKGDKGDDGNDGNDGKSAFELALAAGFTGNEADYLASLHGKSAFEIAKDDGFAGDEPTWLASLVGKDGMLPDFAVTVEPNDLSEADFGAKIGAILSGAKPADVVSYRAFVVDANDSTLKHLSGYTVFPTKTGLYLWAFGKNINGDGKLASVALYKADNGDLNYLTSVSTVKGENGKNGVDGKSAYQLAVAGGYVGTEQQWLASLKGVKGDTGLALNVKATLSDVSELPAPGDYPPGTAFIIDGHWWADLGDGPYVDLGSVLGPEGKSAYDVAVEHGYNGSVEDWLESLKGLDGIGLRILGSFSSTDSLPTSGQLSGDAYIIQSVMYVWDTTRWSPVGQQGPAGLSAYDIAVRNGFAGSQTQWLASLVGQKGEQGVEGKQGEKGESAAAINTKGKVADEASLPQTNNLPGDGYFIGLNLWIWTGDAWEDVGTVKGEKGDQGIQGEPGKQGDPGPQGKDIYALAIENGFTGSFADFLAQYKGEKGNPGNPGPRGLPGPDGKSAFDVAVVNGYKGSVTDWLLSLKGQKGDTGAGITLLGVQPDEASLPAGATVGDAYLIGQHVWIYNGSAWVDGGPVQGPAGKSSYELAVEGGFNGSVEAWLTSLKGDKGDPGTNGESAFEIAQAAGFQGTEQQWLLSLKGTQGDNGKSAYDIAKADGYTGTEAEWLTSLKGKDGTNSIALNYLGLVTAQPSTDGRTLGDAYLLKTNGVTTLIVFQDGAFQSAGKVQGNDGKSSYQIAVDGGFQGTEAQWLATLKGADGKSAYQVAVANGYTGTEPQWLAFIQGQGLTPKGSVATKAALNALTGMAKGDLYVVATNSGDTSAGHMFVYNGTAFIDFGDMRGIQGTQGIQGNPGPDGKSAYDVAKAQGFVGNEAAWLATLVGPDGKSAFDVAVDQGYTGDLPTWLASLKGDKGEKGDVGPGVQIMGKFDNTSQLPTTGDFGQGYLISGNFWGWTGAAYENLGPIQGPKGDPGIRGLTGLKGDPGDKGLTGDKGETGTLWIVLDRPPESGDGRLNDYYLNSKTLEFFRKTSSTLWSSLGFLGGGNVYDASADGKLKARLDGTWVDTPIQADVASTDQGVYLRQNGKWTRLNRYDVAVADSTGAMDVSTAGLFKLDGTKTATISFTNLPANRGMTFVIVLSGKGGSLTWPAALKWSNNEAPTMGDTRTSVVILWDGTNLTGATGLVV